MLGPGAGGDTPANMRLAQITDGTTNVLLTGERDYINNVAGVNTSTRIAPLPLIFGVLLVIGGISEGLQLGWFAVLLGLILLAGCYQAQLNVENSGGGKIKHRISVFNKASAQSFAQEINTMIAERT